MGLGAIRRPLRAKTTQHGAEVPREDVGDEWEGMQASDSEHCVGNTFWKERASRQDWP